MRCRHPLLLLAVLSVCGGLATAAWSVARGPDPVVREWPTWPRPVTCGSLLFNPVKVFSGPTRAERGAGGAEAALRRFLRDPSWRGMPDRDWRLVAKGHGLAEFVHGRVSPYLQHEMTWLRFERERGTWSWSGSGGCIPRTVRGYIPAAEWVLDEVSPPPERNAESIVVRVQERSCSSGRQPYPRLKRPEVRYLNDRALIAFYVKPRRGPQTCQGIRSDPYELKLPRPLGDRKLYDAGTYPPRLITTR